jgi:hypothetical protein
MLRRTILLCVALVPAGAARGGLLDERLEEPAPGPPDLSVPPPGPLLAATGGADKDRSSPGKRGEAGAPVARPGDLDFDLLGEAKAPAEATDAAAMKRRRQLLTVHQGIGFGLVGLQIGTTVLGQLNYRDKFATPANTEKWRMPHKVLAYTTAGVLALNGVIALVAPSPARRPARLDRVTAHRIAMYTAAAGMAAQVALGLYTRSREGYQDQRDLAKIHLYVGYGTLAALATGVGVLVF